MGTGNSPMPGGRVDRRGGGGGLSQGDFLPTETPNGN